MIITKAHLRSVPGSSGQNGYCIPKSRAWFARQGMDWKDFIRNGVDASKLEATNDPFALAIVAHARRQAEESKRGR